MPRYSLPVLGLSSLLLAGHAGALELGDIRVLSAEGDLFRADIELSDVGQLKPLDIAVALASQADFDIAKVQRDSFLSSLQYDVILNGRDGGVIEVSSTSTVPNQDWNFVLEARWPSGRRLKHYLVQNEQRSYTNDNYSDSGDLVFVESSSSNDSPVSTNSSSNTDIYASEEDDIEFVDSDDDQYNDDQYDAMDDESSKPITYKAPASAPEPISSTSSSSSSNTYRATPTISATSSVDSSYQMRTIGEESYTVVRGDSLWEIAHRSRQSDEVSMYQSMQAILELNPHAFIDNDIHRLEKGKVLRIPSEQQVRSYSAVDAKEQIGTQLRRWDEQNGMVRQTDARSTASMDDAGSRGEGVSLSLSSTSGSGSSAQTTEELERELQLRDQLERTLAELDESQQRLQTLGDDVSVRDEEIEDLQNKLAIRNSQLAELRAKLGEEIPQEELAEIVDPEPVSVDEPSDIEDVDTSNTDEFSEPDWNEGLSDDAELEFEEVDTNSTEKPETVIEDPITAAEPVQKNWMDSLPSWAVPAALATLLAGLGWFFLSSRRRRNEERELEAEEDFDLPEHRMAAAEDDRVDQDYVDQEYAAPVVDAPDYDNDVAGTSATEAPLNDDANDPLREADIYMAYGRFPEAADLLDRALEAEPEREDLLEKLMEVHTGSGDTVAYQAAAGKLAELRSGGLSWQHYDDADSAEVTPPTALEAEVSIASAEQLIESGQTYSARMMLEKLVATGSALEKQQARELLHRLA